MKKRYVKREREKEPVARKAHTSISSCTEAPAVSYSSKVKGVLSESCMSHSTVIMSKPTNGKLLSAGKDSASLFPLLLRRAPFSLSVSL